MNEWGEIMSWIKKEHLCDQRATKTSYERADGLWWGEGKTTNNGGGDRMGHCMKEE